MGGGSVAARSVALTVLALLVSTGWGTAAARTLDPGTVCIGVDADVSCEAAAASGTGDARARYVAISGAGDARTCHKFFHVDFRDPCGVALSLTGNSTGMYPISVSGACREEPGDPSRPCFAVAAAGDSSAFWLAASGSGNASCNADVCLAVTGTGNATGQYPVSLRGECRFNPNNDWEPCFEASIESAEGHYVASSVLGSADAEFVAVSGMGDASGGTVSASGTGDAGEHTPTVAISGTGNARGFVAVSGTGDAAGSWAVSGTGEAHGSTILTFSGCETARFFGVDEACFDPELPDEEESPG